MANQTNFPASVRGLLGANVILHCASATLTGIWVMTLVAPDGAMTAQSWIETILSVVAVATGLTYGSYMALRHLPHLDASRRRIGVIAFVGVDILLSVILAIAAASVLASAAGETAHMEASLERMKHATEERRAAFAKITNRVPALTECEDTAGAMSERESETGAFSREGGDVGRVATTLANIANGCGTARDAIYASRANLVRLFARIDRLLLDMRRDIDGAKDRRAKLIAARKAGDEFQRLARGVNDALTVEALRSVSDALRKDWNAAGIPASGAAAITANFDGLADSLTDDLDDIAALKTETLPGVPAVSNTAYLFLYPDATMGAIAIAICIELIPLGGILLGLTILMQNGANSSEAPRPEKPKRPYFRSAASAARKTTRRKAN